MKRLLHAWHWTRALQQSNRGNLTKALSHIHALEKSAALRPYEVAFKGTILLRQRKISQAKEAFLCAVDMIGEPDSDNANYTMLFSAALVHGMNGQLEKEKEALRQAGNIPCSGSLKRWLPLYDVDEFGMATLPDTMPDQMKR